MGLIFLMYQNLFFLKKPVAPQSRKARHFSEIRKSDTISVFIKIKKTKCIDNTKAPSSRVGRQVEISDIYYYHGSDFLNENLFFLTKPVAPQSRKARHFSEIRKSGTIFSFITIKKAKHIDISKAFGYGW